MSSQEQTEVPTTLPELEAEYDEQKARDDAKAEEAETVAATKKAVNDLANLFGKACEAVKPKPELLDEMTLEYFETPMQFGKFRGKTPREVLESEDQESSDPRHSNEGYMRWAVNTVLKKDLPELAAHINSVVFSRRRVKKERVGIKEQGKKKPKALPKPKKPKKKTKAELQLELERMRQQLNPNQAQAYGDGIVS